MSSSEMNMVMGLLSTYLVVVIAVAVLAIVSEWKIFTKAKQPGWASIVPFYGDYVKYKIFWGNGWLFLIPIVSTFLVAVPVLGWILAVVVLIMRILTCKKKATAFGEGTGFAVGLFFLGLIFNAILAFSKKYEYKGVPIDGTSFKELKSKADDIKEKVDEKEAKTTFEEPAPEAKPDVEFAKPEEVKKVEPVEADAKDAPVVDAKIEPKKED